MRYTGYYQLLFFSIMVTSIYAGEPDPIEMRAFFFDEDGECIRSAPSPVLLEEDVFVLEMEEEINADEKTELLLKKTYGKKFFKNWAYFGISDSKLVIHSERISEETQSTCIDLFRDCPFIACWHRYCCKLW